MWWSNTTHRTMRICQRKLVYEHKMASSTTNDLVRREAFLLRQLNTLPEWHGNLVHLAMKNCLTPRLRNRLSFSAEDLTHYAVALADRQWDFSAKHRFREKGMVKTAQGEDYCALEIHEAEVYPSKTDVLREAEEFVRSCFHHLMCQADLIALLQSGSGFVAEHQLTFPFNGATVRAIPDLIFRLPDHRLLVVDWKTVSSETDDYANQLYLYALAALRSERYSGIEPENVLLCEANLLQGWTRDYPVTIARLVAAEDFAYASIREMTALLAGISKDDFQIEDYEVAEKATTCAVCSFRSLCRKDPERETPKSLIGVIEASAPMHQKRTKRLAENGSAAVEDTLEPLLFVEGERK